jgi:predicted nucleotidyltransferase
MDKILDGLVQRLKADARANLRSVVLYGSAASGEYNPKHSDLNILCLLYKTGATELAALHKSAKWLARKGHPMPLIFSLDELRQAADVYAIELFEIKRRRRVLYGEDVFDSLEVPMDLHRLQVERELRHKLIGLRQAYVAAAGNKRAVLALMVRSASTFALLFRHALIAFGEDASGSKHDAVRQLAALLNFDASSFTSLFEVREGKASAKELEHDRVFQRYLQEVTQAVNELDRRFEALNT